jgi:hypothetical protein
MNDSFSDDFAVSKLLIININAIFERVVGADDGGRTRTTKVEGF